MAANQTGFDAGLRAVAQPEAVVDDAMPQNQNQAQQQGVVPPAPMPNFNREYEAIRRVLYANTLALQRMLVYSNLRPYLQTNAIIDPFTTADLDNIGVNHRQIDHLLANIILPHYNTKWEPFLRILEAGDHADLGHALRQAVVDELRR